MSFGGHKFDVLPKIPDPVRPGALSQRRMQKSVLLIAQGGASRTFLQVRRRVDIGLGKRPPASER
jgi:hypothetical protein